MRRASSRRGRWISDREDRRRASYPAESDRAQPDRAHALNEHAIPRAERRALADVDGRQQAAATANVVIDADGVWQPGDADTRLEIDVLRPAAEESLRG